MGAAESGSGGLKIVLKDVKDLNTIYDSSEKEGSIISLTQNPETYSVTYTHNTKTVMDARLAFDFLGKKQVVYLDKVVFVRQ